MKVEIRVIRTDEDGELKDCVSYSWCKAHSGEEEMCEGCDAPFFSEHESLRLCQCFSILSSNASILSSNV